ncbi:glycosyltransferase family 2 protein [Mesorhizobium atlanticum]|nr:glycosyltransferase family 2 protein [Mesorhizobium atlanticum]
MRHTISWLPGGPRLVSLYAAWKAPSLSGFAVSADIPPAIADLAAERSRALLSDWHVGCIRAAKQVQPDAHFVDITMSIVLHNSSRWIEGFTSSLLKSNYPLNKVHLIFVDNDSSDDTVVKVTSWAQNCGKIFGSTSIIRRKNDGYGAGNNAAIALSKTEFVLVTNVDVEFDSNLLRCMVGSAIADNPDVGCWEAMQVPFQHPKYHDPVTLQTNWCSHACVLLRRSAYISVGGYEKRLFMYGEDVELSYRLRAAGWRLRYVPFARLLHHNDVEQQEFRPLQLSGSLAANVLLRHRYGRPIDAFVGEALLRALRATTHDQSRLRAIHAAIRTVRRHRRAFMTTRKRRNGFFPFSGFDYDIIRDGATFKHKVDLSNSVLPKVSIITRTIEGRDWLLKEAISSVLTQTYPNIQHIIVEDRSESASKLVDDVRSVYGADICYCCSTKGGRTAAGNAGLKAATGDLILFLDDDDLLFPDHIETLVQTIQKNPRSICAYSLAWMVRTETDAVAKTYRELSHDVVASHRLPFDRSRLLVENIAAIQSVLFRRLAYESCGGFHEDMDLLEDWNLWCRFSALGSFAFCEKLTSIYRVPADPAVVASRQRGFDESYEDVRNRNLNDIARQMLNTERLTRLSGTDGN